MEAKKCNKCDLTKGLTLFRKSRGMCKDCEAIYEVNRRGKKREYLKEWKLRNEEKIKGYNQKNRSGLPSKKSCRIYINTCPITGILFTSRRNKMYHPSVTPGEISAINSKIDSREHYKTCVVCEKIYYGTMHSKCCSLNCLETNARIQNRINYAKSKGATILERIDPYVIFKAFKYRCACCGKHTPRTLIGTNHNDEPTMDHIIPLSKGGQHTIVNIQCLCRECNTAKSDMEDAPNDLIITKKLFHKLNSLIHEREQTLRRA